MASFRSAVLGRESSELELFETTSALNIRTGSGTEHEKLPASPLPPGTRLNVFASHQLWRQVDVLDAIGDDMDITGWVHGRFIRRVS